MWITAVTVQGFSALPDASLKDLGRVVVRDDPDPEIEALGMALELLFASLDPRRLADFLLHLGFGERPEDIEITGEPLPEQAAWASPDAARALLDPNADRVLRVKATFALDPLQYRTLREEAAHTPDLVAGLSGGSTLEIQVGWCFASALRAVSVGLSGVLVGGSRIPVGAAERPRWLVPFLTDLPHRFLELDASGGGSPGGGAAARAWLEAASSPDPERTRAHRRLAATLAAPPFGLDDPRPVRWNGVRPEVVVGPRGRPVAWEGPAAVAALDLSAAVHLSGAEILWVRSLGPQCPDPTAVRDWLANEAEAPGSLLEQVFLAGGGSRKRRVRAGRGAGA
ncbi:MAG: hypothetical protein JXB39_13585 [Deltaproteobacteria bacterium]|nr:hypothetical protein [Deltaproteobacteria bacterium]